MIKSKKKLKALKREVIFLKRALILMNMGGISNPNEVEVFLKNMFLDKHILPLNPLLRRFIANRIIKNRADEVRENLIKYLNGKSPLLNITNSLAKKLEEKLNFKVVPVMRYVAPFAKDVLKELKAQEVEELILFPMYPQYSTTTTLSSIDDIKENLKKIDYSPKIKIVKSYYDDYEYIRLIVEQILKTVTKDETKEFDLILSAHSIPLKIAKNDLYEKHIEANLSALKIYLKCQNIEFKNIKLAYQSKVGKAKWLEPNLTDTLKQNINRKVIIYPLSFTIDNSETLFELDIENREISKELKYQDYRVVKCFNDNDSFVDFIKIKTKNILLNK